MSKPKITIYSTKTCAFCHALKQYLDGHKVEYEEIMVDDTEDGPQQLVEKSGQMGVPVMDFDGTIVVGFNRPKIDMLLRENKLI